LEFYVAYRLDKFNGAALVVLEDGSLDTTTDLRFIGKNYAGYGEVQNENFLHLLENFANNAAPPRPITGQLWFDSGTIFKKLKVYDGTQWKTVGTSAAAATPPAGLTTGDLWFDTVNNQLHSWDGSQFVLIGPELTPDLTDTDAEKTLVKDIFSNNHYILKLKVDNKVIGIISKDEFVLSSVLNPITGFDRIKKGFTLIDTDGNTGITTSDHYYWGTASNSIRFASRPVTDFVLKEEANKFLDEGFTVGDSNDLRIWVENGDSPVIQGQNPIPSLSTLTLRLVTPDGNDDIAVITPSGISPGLTDRFNLGSTNAKWNELYATDIFGALTGNTTGTHKGNVVDNSNVVRFNSTNGSFIGNLTGNVTGNVTGSTTGTHKGNLLSNDGVVRFNASTVTFTGDLVGNVTGNVVGNVNGLATNVTGVVASINGGTGFVQYDDGQILIGDGTILTKGRITGIEPIVVARTPEGFNIGFTGGVGTVSSVGVTAGTGISVSGSPVTSSGNITITNTGVTAISAGTGLSASASTGGITLTNTGVTQIVAGSNITVSPTNGTGIVTINSTATSSGVTRIIAGSNVSINPGSGTGDVTISASVSGSGSSTLSGLSDVSIGSPSIGQVLKWNGSRWVNGTDEQGGGGGGGGGDMFLASIQTVTGLKEFTGGIISQAYNFTSTGNSIFHVTSPANTVQIAVDNSFPHYFYKERFLVEGSGDLRSGERGGGGGTIIGIDNGTTGAAGIAGVHTNSQPGLGMGVSAGATNNGFTGAVIQGTSVRAKSSSFIGFRLYASSGGDPYFVVRGNGNVSYDGVASTPAADYAEYFEWIDGNPENEDRAGMTVSLVGNKIKIAESGDSIIGVVSAVPAVVGDAAELEWQGKFLKDDFGRVIEETYFYYEWIDDNGSIQSEPSYGDLTRVPEGAERKDTDGFGDALTRPKYNPEYDPSVTYVPRSKRKEWSPIGLLGKLRVLKNQHVSNSWIKLRSINDNLDEWLVK